MSTSIKAELIKAKAQIAELERTIRLLKQKEMIIPAHTAEAIDKAAITFYEELTALGLNVADNFLQVRLNANYENKGFYLSDLDRNEIHWEIQADDHNCQVLVPKS